MKALVCFNLPPPSAFHSSHVVIDCFISVCADGDCQFRWTHLHDFPNAALNLHRQITIRGKMNHREIRAILDGRRNYPDKVFSQPYLPAGEIDPIKPIRLSEKRIDLVQCQLVFGFALPDVASLALIVAPVRHAERELVWEPKPAEI
jgi:hypothetical protein